MAEWKSILKSSRNSDLFPSDISPKFVVAIPNLDPLLPCNLDNELRPEDIEEGLKIKRVLINEDILDVQYFHGEAPVDEISKYVVSVSITFLSTFIDFNILDSFFFLKQLIFVETI